jgi:hypothetical protein
MTWDPLSGRRSRAGASKGCRSLGWALFGFIPPILYADAIDLDIFLLRLVKTGGGRGGCEGGQVV